MKKRIITVALMLIMVSAVWADGFQRLDPNTVNGLDRLLMSPYSSVLDHVGTGLEIASVLMAAVLISTPRNQWLTVGTMYAETMVAAYGLRTLGKHFIDRARPYLYYDNPPMQLADDFMKSFPSGHATIAFASAAFTSYVFCKCNPDSKWKVPVVIGTYAIATATAVLRLASGNHFLTDVLAGAAIGTACGLLIPRLHLSGRVGVDVCPFSLAFRIQL